METRGKGDRMDRYGIKGGEKGAGWRESERRVDKGDRRWVWKRLRLVGGDEETAAMLSDGWGDREEEEEKKKSSMDRYHF